MLISKEDLINDVLSVKSQCQGNFTREYYLKHGKYSRAPIKRYFGAWNNMLIELGIELNVYDNPTKEEVLEDMRRLINKYGKLTANIQRKESKYSQVTIDKMFGSFSSMLEELGYQSKYKAREMTDNELLKIAKDLYDRHGYVNSTLLHNESGIPAMTYYNRFGTMANIYEKLGVKNNPNTPCYFSSVDYVIGIIARHLEENPIINWTDDKLRNPITGARLYVDAFFSDHKLAVEYDGQQHFEYIPFLHGGDAGKFIRQQECDRWKDCYIIGSNLALLRIRYDEPKTVEHITKRVDDLLNHKS